MGKQNTPNFTLSKKTYTKNYTTLCVILIHSRHYLIYWQIINMQIKKELNKSAPFTYFCH